jgi:hypothetical protein
VLGADVGRGGQGVILSLVKRSGQFARSGCLKVVMVIGINYVTQTAAVHLIHFQPIFCLDNYIFLESRASSLGCHV